MGKIGNLTYMGVIIFIEKDLKLFLDITIVILRMWEWSGTVTKKSRSALDEPQNLDRKEVYNFVL